MNSLLSARPRTKPDLTIPLNQVDGSLCIGQCFDSFKLATKAIDAMSAATNYAFRVDKKKIKCDNRRKLWR